MSRWFEAFWLWVSPWSGTEWHKRVKQTNTFLKGKRWMGNVIVEVYKITAVIGRGNNDCSMFQELDSIKWQVASSKQKKEAFHRRKTFHSFISRLWNLLLQNNKNVKVNKKYSENNQIHAIKIYQQSLKNHENLNTSAKLWRLGQFHGKTRLPCLYTFSKMFFLSPSWRHNSWWDRPLMYRSVSTFR